MKQYIYIYFAGMLFLYPSDHSGSRTVVTGTHSRTTPMELHLKKVFRSIWTRRYIIWNINLRKIYYNMKPKCDFTTGCVVDDKGLEPWGRHQLCLRLFETHRSLHPNVGHSLWRFAAKWRLPPGVGWWQCQDHVSQRWFDNSGRICHIVHRHSTRKWRHKLRVDGSAWLWWNRRHVSMNFFGLSETLWCAWLCPTLRREGIYWFHLVRPSVLPSAHLPVSGQNRVRSVSSTILARSISYLHILSTKFRRCVACRVFSYKIPKFYILPNVFSSRCSMRHTWPLSHSRPLPRIFKMTFFNIPRVSQTTMYPAWSS